MTCLILQERRGHTVWSQHIISWSRKKANELWFVVPNREGLVFEKVNGPFFWSSDIHNQHPLCTYSIY